MTSGHEALALLPTLRDRAHKKVIEVRTFRNLSGQRVGEDSVVIDDAAKSVHTGIDEAGLGRGRHFTAVDKKSLDMLQSYAWPGNSRELRHGFATMRRRKRGLPKLLTVCKVGTMLVSRLQTPRYSCCDLGRLIVNLVSFFFMASLNLRQTI